MRNPFAPVSQAARLPLRPWQYQQHVHYYSSVDHIDAALGEFEAAIQHWDTSVTGSAVFVSGENGCGKSSLIHRCVHVLSSKLNTKPKPWIVDLIDEPHPDGAQAKAKCAASFLMDRLTEDLGNSLLEVDINFITEKNVDLSISVSRLASRLRQNNLLLFFLVPKVMSIAEFNEFVNVFYRHSIVIFLETSDISLSRFCSEHHGIGTARPVLSLPIGKVGASDSVLFKNDRMRLANKEAAVNIPDFPDAAAPVFWTAG
jgi:hypothetical protein